MDGFGKCIPPEKEHVIVYFLQKGHSEKKAIDFYYFYGNRKWLGKKDRPVKDWKRAAWYWIMNLL